MTDALSHALSVDGYLRFASISDSQGKVIHPKLWFSGCQIMSYQHPFTAVMLVPPGIECWRVWWRWKLIGGICLRAWSQPESPSLPYVRRICHCRRESGRSQERTGSSPESLYDVSESQLRAFRALHAESRESAGGFSLRLLSLWSQTKEGCHIVVLFPEKQNYSRPFSCNSQGHF